MISKLIDAGMNVARLNFSHGDHEVHLNSLRNLRQVSSYLFILIMPSTTSYVCPMTSVSYAHMHICIYANESNVATAANIIVVIGL